MMLTFARHALHHQDVAIRCDHSPLLERVAGLLNDVPGRGDRDLLQAAQRIVALALPQALRLWLRPKVGYCLQMSCPAVDLLAKGPLVLRRRQTLHVRSCTLEPLHLDMRLAGMTARQTSEKY